MHRDKVFFRAEMNGNLATASGRKSSGSRVRVALGHWCGDGIGFFCWNDKTDGPARDGHFDVDWFRYTYHSPKASTPQATNTSGDRRTMPASCSLESRADALAQRFHGGAAEISLRRAWKGAIPLVLVIVNMKAFPTTEQIETCNFYPSQNRTQLQRLDHKMVYEKFLGRPVVV